MPEELANVTMKVRKMRKIKGLFLSFSVEKDPSISVEKEIETVKILREKGFIDYVHLRLMPGVDIDLIKQSVEIADRVGINIEFPRKEHYDDMKISLDFRQDLIKRIRILAHEISKRRNKANAEPAWILGWL